jgi:hypothetical protein
MKLNYKTKFNNKFDQNILGVILFVVVLFVSPSNLTNTLIR